METMHILSFLLYTLTLISFWVRNTLKIWLPLFCGALIFGYFGEILNWSGIGITALLGLVWWVYLKQKHPSIRGALFLLILLSAYAFKFHLMPGFPPLVLNGNIKIGYLTAFIGFFPLALLVPLAQTKACWKKVFLGLWWGILGIITIYILAAGSSAIRWDPHLPNDMWTRYWSMLFLMVIPEEAFFRGFIQHRLCAYLQNTRWGKAIGVTAATLLFTLAHLFWVPSYPMLIFVFVAGLVYGGVYLKTGKIESAILTHFLLNFLLINFFSF